MYWTPLSELDDIWIPSLTTTSLRLEITLSVKIFPVSSIVSRALSISILRSGSYHIVYRWLSFSHSSLNSSNLAFLILTGWLGLLLRSLTFPLSRPDLNKGYSSKNALLFSGVILKFPSIYLFVSSSANNRLASVPSFCATCWIMGNERVTDSGISLFICSTSFFAKSASVKSTI